MIIDCYLYLVSFVVQCDMIAQSDKDIPFFGNDWPGPDHLCDVIQQVIRESVSVKEGRTSVWVDVGEGIVWKQFAQV